MKSLVVAIALISSISGAEVIRIPLQSINANVPNAVGLAHIVSHPNGPDTMVLQVDNLVANTIFTAFLTNSPTGGSLPVQFLGQFTTNNRGAGQIEVKTEIVNAYATANQTLENQFGIANILGAGVIARGANTIPLNFIRVYFGNAANVPTVFGTSERAPGGFFVLASTVALP